WLQTGEMIQVGGAWRLIDAPVPGAASADDDKGGKDTLADPRLQKMVEELGTIDREGKDLVSAPGPDPKVVAHHQKRADLLEKIIALDKPESRDQWIRQLADSLSTAAQSSPAGETAGYERLLRLEKQIVAAMPGSNLAAYVTFREMQADYSIKIA